MKRRGVAGVIAVIISLICAATALSATVPTLVTFGPNEDQHAQRPSVIYLSADAGPEFVHIHWTGWGTAKAVGHGVLDEGQGGARRRVSATLTLTGLHLCPTGANRTYARGTLITDAMTRRLIFRFPGYAPIAYCR